MNDAALKIDLLNKIKGADSNQLRDLYGLITNYFKGAESLEEWDLMPEIQRAMILEGLEEADAGLGTPLEEVNKNLRKKYGLDG